MPTAVSGERGLRGAQRLVIPAVVCQRHVSALRQCAGAAGHGGCIGRPRPEVLASPASPSRAPGPGEFLKQPTRIALLTGDIPDPSWQLRLKGDLLKGDHSPA